MRSFRMIPAVLLAIGWMGSARFAAADEPNTLTDAEKADGFKLLFDGKTTTGWRGYKKDKMPAGWEVVDGALVRTKGGGDIVTVDEFDAFELHIDWKIAPKGNSGVMYHVQEIAGAPYETGPEMQVLDNKGHGDGKNPKTSAGALYAMVPPTKDVTKPVGEWNSAKLIVRPDGSCEHWLNGEKIVEYKKGGEEWDKMVAGSKFKSMKNFGKPTKGHIDLQDHGDHVEYRNIKIKVLSAK